MRHAPKTFLALRSVKMLCTLSIATLTTTLFAQPLSTVSLEGNPGQLGVSFSPIVMPIEIPNVGTVFLAPRSVDASQGAWRGPEIQEQFAEASGSSFETVSKQKWPNGGAEATIKLNASVQGKRIIVKLNWELQGDDVGHIRLDLLIPADVADRVRILGGDGSTMFESEMDSLPVGITPPISILEKDSGKLLLTIESSGQSVAVVRNPNYERMGIDIRFSPYRSGADVMLSEESGLELTIIYP